MNTCKILIIDDDTDDVEILVEAFTQCGVDGVQYVSTAMNAFIYLQQLELKNLPKLIITDLFLPGITGAQFLQDLKGMDKYKHIPVVLTSSTKSESEIERYRQMGALDYVVKPVTYQEYVDIAAEIKRKAELA
jgi:CheY-like chemotaxis protein